jgi:integrase
VEAWPEIDRLAWSRALVLGDLLEAGGPAEHWRPATRRFVAENYGFWLSWLADQGVDVDAETLSARQTRERLGAYIEHLRSRVSLATIENRLIGLERALAVMSPETDRSLLKRAIRRVRDPHAGIAGKRIRLQDSRDLFALGIRLMSEADDPVGESYRRTRWSTHYRDGLIIALLAARPLRRRNFAGLVLGRHVQLVQDQWWICIPAEETKTRMAIEVPFPEALVDSLDRYLKEHRPRLLNAPVPETCDILRSGPLWISIRTGAALSPHTLALRVAEHTGRAFGKPVNVHLFRDCAATSIALRDAEHIRIAASVLGHRRFATTERHYNLARSVEAAADYHSHLDRLRQET